MDIKKGLRICSLVIGLFTAGCGGKFYKFIEGPPTEPNLTYGKQIEVMAPFYLFGTAAVLEGSAKITHHDDGRCYAIPDRANMPSEGMYMIAVIGSDLDDNGRVDIPEAYDKQQEVLREREDCL